MPLLALGINHKTTPLQIREQLAVNYAEIPPLLQDLLKHPAVNEAVLLSTCNRTEMYLSATENCNLMNWFLEKKLSDNQKFTSDTPIQNYFYQDVDAVKHLIRVATGLDSMILGETEILGQVKEAYRLAYQSQTIGPEFKYLFPAVFSVAKEIRTKTQIGAHPVSMAYAILQLARQIFPSLSDCKVLLIGAGCTIELILNHLKDEDIKQLCIANRNPQNAKQIAKNSEIKIIRLEELRTYLPTVDLIISATNSSIPIIGKGLMEEALRIRKRKPIFIADLAVPRDVEPEVCDLEDIYLYNIDDLQSIISQNLKCRKESAKQAEGLVNAETEHYFQKLRILKASDMIRKFRTEFETHRDQELTKALEHWQKTQNPQASLAYLAHNLTNKLLHKPTKRIRQALYDEELDLLMSVEELFK